MGLATQTFDVLSRIAVGNGSLVYRALEKETLRQVALKLLTKDDEFDHLFDVPALLEAAPQMRLITGSHVCQLLDAFDDEDGPVLVYEYANGISGNEFPHKSKLDAAQAVDVAAQLMSALRSGERQRVPHGDLKPSNVIIVETPEGRPFTFVLDWGLAAFRSEMPKDSRPYLAPERLLGGPVSHQADLFAAGALLFYLYTGKVLAMGETDEELLSGWSRARPELLGELRPDLPPRLVQWIGYLLALDPQKRPALAIDAATALTPLNPPPPMVPPEAIRPRPLSASQRAQAAAAAASASGISAPAPSRMAAPPASGVARLASSGAQPGSAMGPMPATRMIAEQNASAVVGSRKKLPAAMVVITLGVATAIAGTGIWWFNREKVTPAPPAFQPAAPQITDNKKPGQKDGKSTAAKSSSSGSSKKEPPAAAKPPSAKPGTPKPSPAKATAKSSSGSKPASNASRPAEPLVLESFAYAAESDPRGQKAGRGWAGSWEGKGGRIRGESLEYPEHPVSGGSLIIPAGNETVELRRAAVPATKFIEKPSSKDAHWYFAALVSHTDATPAAGGEVRLHPVAEAGGGSAPAIVITDAGAGIEVSMRGASKPVIVADGGKPLLVVCRVELTNPKNGKWDMETSVLVNPPLQAANFRDVPGAMKAKVGGATMPAQIGLLIRKDGGKAITIVDEVRYSAHWKEISFGRTKPKGSGEKTATKKATKPN